MVVDALMCFWATKYIYIFICLFGSILDDVSLNDNLPWIYTRQLLSQNIPSTQTNLHHSEFDQWPTAQESNCTWKAMVMVCTWKLSLLPISAWDQYYQEPRIACRSSFWSIQQSIPLRHLTCTTDTWHWTARKGATLQVVRRIIAGELRFLWGNRKSNGVWGVYKCTLMGSNIYQWLSLSWMRSCHDSKVVQLFLMSCVFLRWVYGWVGGIGLGLMEFCGEHNGISCQKWWQRSWSREYRCASPSIYICVVEVEPIR